MKVELFVNTGYVGCRHIAYVDVPNETTKDELNEMALEFMRYNRIYLL